MPTSSSLQRALASLDDLVEFPQRIQDVSARFQEIPMGRWTIGVNTRTGSFLLGNSVERHFEFDADFPDTRHALYEVRDQAEDEFEAAWPRIQAVQQWIEGTLQGLGAELADVASLAAAGDASSAKRVAQLSAQLAHSSEILKSAEAGIAELCALQDRHEALLEAVHARLLEEVHQRFNELHDFLDDQPSGQRDALNQFSHLQTQLTSTMREAMAIAGQMRHDTRAAHRAVEFWADAVGALRVDVERVGASGASPEIISAMDSADTASDWSAAASTAAGRLQSHRLRSPIRPASLRARATARRD